MQKISVENIKPGSIIAKDVYTDDGLLIISKGVAFRVDFIDRFKDIGIDEILIEDSNVIGTEPLNSSQRKIEIADVIYEKTRTQAEMQIKKTMVRFCATGNVNISQISSLVDKIIDQLLTKKEIVFALSQLRSIDDYTYRHSVNVCVLSLVLGIDLRLDQDSLKNLGIGAMLHDIGKVLISEDILKKPTKLTKEEFEEIKKHTEYGYEILMQTEISPEAAMIALCHHEKYDGSGYNKGMKQEKIPLFSRIVALADVYDAMSNDRIYQKKSPANKVFREIAHLGDKHFDKTLMEQFLSHLHIYPNGTGIVLNTNHRGIVIGQNKLFPESPIIRLFKEEKNNLKDLYTDIDLSLAKYLYIIDTY